MQLYYVIITHSWLHYVSIYQAFVFSLVIQLYSVIPYLRKHVTKKKRAKTFMAPIEEQEDVGVVLTATTVCEEGLQVRRASIMDILRRGTGEFKKKTKQQEGQLEPENLKRLNTDGKISSSRPKSSIDPERRSNLLANISLKIENKN